MSDIVKRLKYLQIITLVAMTAFFTGCGMFKMRLTFPNLSKRIVKDAIDKGIIDPKIDYNSPLLNQRIIIINSDINRLTATKVISKLFYLNSKDKSKVIDIFLNTEGGDGHAAFTIIEAINKIKAPVNVWAFVEASSAGIIILQAATGKRIATSNSIFLIHGGIFSENCDKKYVDIMNNNYLALLKKKSKLPEKWFPLKPDIAHILSPEEALKYGLIDVIKSNDRKTNPNEVAPLDQPSAPRKAGK